MGSTITKLSLMTVAASAAADEQSAAPADHSADADDHLASACQTAASLVEEFGRSTNGKPPRGIALATGTLANKFYENIGDRQLVLLEVDISGSGKRSTRELVVVKTERHRDHNGALFKPLEIEEDTEAKMYGYLSSSRCKNLLSGATIVDEHSEAATWKRYYTNCMIRLLKRSTDINQKADRIIRNWREKADARMLIRYMFIPYSGDTLENFLERTDMTPDLARSLSLQLCEAFGNLHKAGMCHLDLKDENMCVRDDGTLVIIDYDSGRIKREVEVGAHTTAMWMTDQRNKYFWKDFKDVQDTIRTYFDQAGVVGVTSKADFETLKEMRDEVVRIIKVVSGLEPGHEGESLDAGDIFFNLRRFYELYARSKREHTGSIYGSALQNLFGYHRPLKNIQCGFIKEQGCYLLNEYRGVEGDNTEDEEIHLRNCSDWWEQNFKSNGRQVSEVADAMGLEGDDCRFGTASVRVDGFLNVESFYFVSRLCRVLGALGKRNERLEQVLEELNLNKERKALRKAARRKKRLEREAAAHLTKSQASAGAMQDLSQKTAANFPQNDVAASLNKQFKDQKLKTSSTP